MKKENHLNQFQKSGIFLRTLKGYLTSKHDSKQYQSLTEHFSDSSLHFMFRSFPVLHPKNMFADVAWLSPVFKLAPDEHMSTEAKLYWLA